MAVSVLVGNDHHAGFLEFKRAHALSHAVLGLAPLVKKHGRLAIRMTHIHRHVGGPVAVGRIGDTHLVTSGLELGLKTNRGTALVLVTIVLVSPADKGGGGSAGVPIARNLGLGIIDNDALEVYRFPEDIGGNLQLQHLPISQETLAEFFVRQILHGDILIQGHHGGGGRRLAEDHEYRLHADGAKGNVRTGNAHRHQ